MPFQQAPNTSVQLPVFLPGTREHQFGQTTPGSLLSSEEIYVDSFTGRLSLGKFPFMGKPLTASL